MSQRALCLYNCFCCCVSFDTVCVPSLMPQLTIVEILFYNNNIMKDGITQCWLSSNCTIDLCTNSCPVALTNATASGVHPTTGFWDSVLTILQPVLWILQTASALLHLLLEQKPWQPGYILVMRESNSRSFQSSLKTWLNMAQPLKAMKLPISEKLEI